MFEETLLLSILTKALAQGPLPRPCCLTFLQTRVESNMLVHFLPKSDLKGLCWWFSLALHFCIAESQHVGVSDCSQLDIKELGETESPDPKGFFYLAYNIFGFFAKFCRNCSMLT